MIQLIPALLMFASASSADSVTGCLQKGTTAGTYTLTPAGGKAYQVTSKTLKLDGHVGHTMTLTGDMKGQAIDATKSTMVSASCS